MSSLLPPSASRLMRTIEAVAEDRLGALPVSQLATLANPATCPVQVLPFLAWAYSVDAWSEAWSESEKRAVVGASLRVHARKGTRGAVNDAMAAFGAGLLLTEWWQAEPPATPHTFTLRIAAGADRGTAYFRALFEQLDRAKPLRDHYTALVDSNATGGFEIGIVGSSAVFHHITTTAVRA